jgi:uncharacterized protein (TIGR02996 family)
MADTERALLRAVLEYPDDDNPRLVMADWWEEHGQSARAEFCRVQCELATFRVPGHYPHHSPECPYPGRGGPRACRCGTRRFLSEAGEEYEALRRREGALFDAHGPDWAPPEFYPALGDVERVAVEPAAYFRRGFVDSVSLTLAQLWGEACGRCGGRGYPWLTGVDPKKCDACKGEGRVKGVAPKLFSLLPLTRVTLTDREPLEDRGGYCWQVGDGNRAFMLPFHIWVEGVPTISGPHPTRALALAAASDACVALGRSVADVPPRRVTCGRCEGQRFPGYFDSDSLADAFSIELENRRCPACKGEGTVEARGLPPLKVPAKGVTHDH